MYIGNLLDASSGVELQFEYRRRGSQEIILPKPLEAGMPCGEQMSVLCRGVVVEAADIGDNGVDICINFGVSCFIDNISLSFGEPLYSDCVTIFSETDAKPVGIYRCETGGEIGSGSINVTVGVECTGLIIRLDGAYGNIAIENIGIYGMSNYQSFVYPLPQNAQYSTEKLSAISRIVADDADGEFAGAYFAERCPESLIGCDGGKELRLIRGKVEEEEFVIDVTLSGATITANSRRGFLYAASKLLQLSDNDGISCAHIEDKPYMELRGVHFALPAKKDLPFLKRLIKYALVPLGYNHVIIQLSALMEYKSHPKINEVWQKACKLSDEGKIPTPPHYGFLGDEVYTHQEIRELCEYIRSFGIEIVPEVQSFGHTQYITMAYPDMAEPENDCEEDINLFEADAKPNAEYHHTLCPLHDNYYKVFFDIIDEVVEVIKPERYIHIGHDEIYTIGKCHKCRQVPPEKLYSDEVTALYEHISQKGLKVMMWSDMLTEKAYETVGAINTIPKDILCLPFTWYFHTDEDTELPISEHGFEYMIGNFYSSHYPRFNKRKKFKGLRGAEVSTWVPCNEDYYCYEGKMWEIIYSSSMLWNETYLENMRRSYTFLCTNVSDKIMRELRNEKVSSVQMTELLFEKQASAVPYDIRDDYTGAVKVSGKESFCINADVTSSSLHFVQACTKNAKRIPWQELEAMGSYTITFEDGTSASADICYGRDICEYSRAYAQPLKSVLFRHEGYTATCFSTPVCGKTSVGLDYTLYRYSWSNPFPAKKIVKIELSHYGETDADIILFGIYADKQSI